MAGTPPTGQDIEYLVDRCASDFELFKELSGLDVSRWSLQRLLDGALAPEELADRNASQVVAQGWMRRALRRGG